jgi:hypothetical protein
MRNELQRATFPGATRHVEEERLCGLRRAGEAHKKRVDRAFAKSLDDPAAFARRLPKLRARFEDDLALVRTEFEKMGPETSAPPPRPGAAVENPTGEHLAQEEGYIDRKRGPNSARTAEMQPWDGTPASALEEVEERVRELMEDEGISEMMAYERVIGENPSRFDMAKRRRLDVCRGDQQPPGLEADPVLTSEAYRKLSKRAEQDRREGETPEQTFARVYADSGNRTAGRRRPSRAPRPRRQGDGRPS